MVSTTTLKNAAKALGYDLWSDPDGSHYLVDYDGVKLKRWDPEHNSADSFALMTALRLDVLNDHNSATAKKFDSFNQRVVFMFTEYDGKPDERAMLAILNCASGIGAAL